MTNRHIVDRALPERAKLQFFFPNTSEGEDYFVVDLPFFENPTIKESKKARYQKYGLISRSSNLYSYLGADSKMLNINFNINLSHILEEHPDITYDQFLHAKGDFNNSIKEKDRFLKPESQTPLWSLADRLGTKYTMDMAKESASQVLNSDWVMSGITLQEYDNFVETYGLVGNFQSLSDAVKNRTLTQNTTGLSDNPEVVSTFTGAFGNVLGMATAHAFMQTQAMGSEFGRREQRNKIIDIIIYWVNIIRSSVVNNAQNPIFGPPVIRLRHGVMYQDIPCICTDYTIGWNEAAGYDVHTLLPRQLQIGMKLEEFRTGDFGVWNHNNVDNPIKRDNLAGWESVVLGDTNSMDPGYFGVGSYY